MSLEAIIARVEAAGLLPVVRAKSNEQAIELSKALHLGGIECLEVTLTVPGAIEVIAELSRELGDAALVGAGTVLSAEDGQRCLDAGARFLVSPGYVPGLIATAHRANVPAMIGALTPSEVIAAWKEGADFVKIFPCSALGGASYLKALSAPLPQVKLLPTGGVTLETMANYLAAGAAALGVGAALADVELLEREGPAALTALAERYTERFRAARAGRR
jgi:2-dehydro-3-deoxyphosphogluconate aldolase/(4S)-4-hydroxy-2-oxoglutarate aldolase